tara:strand:- start:74078 stop:74338 length:261 start_codon:yes stop_codon:yes gene_type:complete
MSTDTEQNAEGEVTYLGSISLEKDQVQKIVVNYLVNHNPDLQEISEDNNSLKFRPVWLTDDSFMEVHFTRLEDSEEEIADLSDGAT